MELYPSDQLLSMLVGTPQLTTRARTGTRLLFLRLRSSIRTVLSVGNMTQVAMATTAPQVVVFKLPLMFVQRRMARLHSLPPQVLCICKRLAATQQFGYPASSEFEFPHFANPGCGPEEGVDHRLRCTCGKVGARGVRFQHQLLAPQDGMKYHSLLPCQ